MDEAAEIRENDIRKYIESVRWRESQDKSHSYTLHEWAPTMDRLFYSFANFIREHGYAAWYWGKQYTCFDVDGDRYWTMGAPLEDTILINRAKNLPGDPHRGMDYPRG
jgi:hypothetical protein